MMLTKMESGMVTVLQKIKISIKTYGHSSTATVSKSWIDYVVVDRTKCIRKAKHCKILELCGEFFFKKNPVPKIGCRILSKKSGMKNKKLFLF